VDTFLENGARLFEVAEASAHTADGADWDILIGEEGAIRMIAASDWSLDSLKAHHGARVAYRVRRGDSKVSLEGRAGARTCLFETATPDRAARLLLAPPVAGYTIVAGPALLP
jgi:hypothetical protein